MGTCFSKSGKIGFNLCSAIASKSPPLRLILIPGLASMMECSLSRNSTDGMRKYQSKKGICYYAMSRHYQSPPASSLPRPCPRWLSISRLSNPAESSSSDSCFTTSISTHGDQQLRPRRLVCAAKFSAVSAPDDLEKNETETKLKENDKADEIVAGNNNTEEIGAGKGALQGLYCIMGDAERRHEKVPPSGGA